MEDRANSLNSLYAEAIEHVGKVDVHCIKKWSTLYITIKQGCPSCFVFIINEICVTVKLRSLPFWVTTI